MAGLRPHESYLQKIHFWCLSSVGHNMCPHLFNFHAQYFYVLVPEIGKLITRYWLSRRIT